MSIHSPFPTAPAAGRLAVFIDGDNVARSHFPAIRGQIAHIGRPKILQAHGGLRAKSGWHDTAGVEFVFAGAGKNAADVNLALTAFELGLSGAFDKVLIVSSDGDFRHLAFRLRRHGIRVHGLGEPKAPASFQDACDSFAFLTDLPQDASRTSVIDSAIAEVLSTGEMSIQMLGSRLSQVKGLRAKDAPGGSWSKYIERSHRFELDETSQPPLVRTKSKAARPSPTGILFS